MSYVYRLVNVDRGCSSDPIFTSSKNPEQKVTDDFLVPNHV